MEIPEYTLETKEKAMLALRQLYAQSGYLPYTMSKFEEYDLYAKNRAFLKGEEIMTFTDFGGKLMALKPDVTISIVKNDAGEGKTRKVYYNENVYRAEGSYHEFHERMQSGLECIGEIDLFAVCEVLDLAAKSLKVLGGDSLLAVSHMGFVAGLLDEAEELTKDGKREILACISAKNEHALRLKCAEKGLSDDLTDRLAKLAGIYAPLNKSIKLLREISVNEKTDEAVDELEAIASAFNETSLALDDMREKGRTVAGLEEYRHIPETLKSEEIMIDFSLVNDMSYYNGIIFQGFISGVPETVLSGGRYDNLLRRFGKQGGAIGFAVYLDLLARFSKTGDEYDIDTLLVYDEKSAPKDVFKAMASIKSLGRSIRAVPEDNGDIRYRTKLIMQAGGIIR